MRLFNNNQACFTIMSALVVCAAVNTGNSVIPLPSPSAATAASVSAHGDMLGGMSDPHAGMGGSMADPHAGLSGLQNPHAMMDMSSTKGLSPQPELDSQIAALAKKGGANVELAALYVKRGNARMMDNQASPHAKYPAALRDYGAALKLDPNNQIAKNNKNLIEEIYRGMGRPVPTD